MKAKSLSVFHTRLTFGDARTTLVNIGDVIEGDDDHLRALARNRLVELLDDDVDGAADVPVAAEEAVEEKHEDQPHKKPKRHQP